MPAFAVSDGECDSKVFWGLYPESLDLGAFSAELTCMQAAVNKSITTAVSTRIKLLLQGEHFVTGRPVSVRVKVALISPIRNDFPVITVL